MDHRLRGLAPALCAYLLWGFLPLYFRLLRGVPPIELVAWRALFTLPLCLGVIALSRGGAAELRAVLADPRRAGALAASGLMIGSNWVVFMMAVLRGHVLATSLGYYINPLVSIALGTVLLGERLSRLQWLAVALAAAGIALLLRGALDMLGVALTLAITFGLYGLIRKLAPVSAVTGLAVETLVLAPFSAAAAAWFAHSPAGSSLAHAPTTAALLAGAGVLTAIPLLLFATAARRLPLSTLGFIQFLSPTITFVLGLTVMGERLSLPRLMCFMLIWSAVAVFCLDLWRRRARLS